MRMSTENDETKTRRLVDQPCVMGHILLLLMFSYGLAEARRRDPA